MLAVDLAPRPLLTAAERAALALTELNHAAFGP